MSTWPIAPDQTSLWSTPSAEAHAAEVRVLATLAELLAMRAREQGITIDNVITAAAQRGIMPLIGKGRAHSFLGAVCRNAGLVPTGRRIRSKIDGKNGNLRQVWIHPSFAPLSHP